MRMVIYTYIELFFMLMVQYILHSVNYCKKCVITFWFFDKCFSKNDLRRF